MGPFKGLWELSLEVCQRAPEGWQGACSLFWFWAFNVAMVVVLIALVVAQVRQASWRRAERKSAQYAENPKGARQESTALDVQGSTAAQIHSFHGSQAAEVVYDEYKEARNQRRFGQARQALKSWNALVRSANDSEQLKRDRDARFEAEMGGLFLTEALFELKAKSGREPPLVRKAIPHLKRSIMKSSLDGDLAALSFSHARLAAAMRLKGNEDKAVELAVRARALALHTKIEGFRQVLEDFLDGAGL